MRNRKAINLILEFKAWSPVTLLAFLLLLGHIYLLGLFCGVVFLGLFYILLGVGLVSIISFVSQLNWSGVSIQNKVFSFCILMAVLMFWGDVDAMGGWDAGAIWNLNAKFIEAGAWEQILHSAMTTLKGEFPLFHNDYPLLYPTLLSLFSVGGISAVSSGFFALVVFLVFCLVFLKSFQGKGRLLMGGIALMLLLADSLFMAVVTFQYADVLLALVFFIAFVLMRQAQSDGDLALLGFFAASGLNLKNEGMLFFAGVVIILLFRLKRKQWRYFILGSLIPLICYAVFKGVYAPHNDLVNSRVFENALHHFFDFERIALVFNLWYADWMLHVWVFLLMGLSGMLFSFKPFLKLENTLPLFVFAGYTVLYMLTPHDVSWHMSTSADRLTIHLLPILTFLAFDGFANGMKGVRWGKVLGNKETDSNSETH